jgi:hypothetical protein
MRNSLILKRIALIIGKLTVNINSFFCSNRRVVILLLNVKYHSKIVAIEQLYKKQNLNISLEEIKKAIVEQYYKMDYCNRTFVIDIITACALVKNTEPIRIEKKPGRNDIITIKKVISGEQKQVKFKKAILLIEKGEWVIIKL